MDPQRTCCPNTDCPGRGQVGQGTIRVHSQRERRYSCKVCRRTFAASRGTPFSRLHNEAVLMLVVLTLLSYGCPVPAIVAAFLLDERTVAAWLQRAGQHASRCTSTSFSTARSTGSMCKLMSCGSSWSGSGRGRRWPWRCPVSRLWLGGVISPQRNKELITALVQQVRACAASLDILVVGVDGLASYVTAFLRVFRDESVRTGRRGRPRLVVEPGLLIGQVVKRYAQRRVVSTSRRVVRGTTAAM